MNASQLFKYLTDNFKVLDSMSNEIIQIETKDFYFGDEYSNECGDEYIIYFSDKTAYRVTKTYYNEIDDNGYNDGYSNHSVREYYEDNNCTADEIFNKIQL